MTNNEAELDKILDEYYSDRKNYTGTEGTAHRRANRKIQALISDHTRKARLDELTIIHERFIAGQDYKFNKWLNIHSRALKQPTVEEE